MMPETRGRTSATRVGAMRPGSSRTMERACGLTVMTLTSGSVGWVATEAMADSGSLQPASSGAMAVSTSKMPADRTRIPDIWMISPN